MDIEFKSARELYMKVIPALNTKRRILNKKGIKISDKEIFEYLVKNIRGISTLWYSKWYT